MNHLLDVYFGRTKAGILSQDDVGMLSYLAGGAPRAISFSLPLQEAPHPDRIVRPFFSGLLPDESARQRLARAWNFRGKCLRPP